MRTWLRSWSNSKTPRLRLLCFPGLVSGAHMYRNWARLLPADIAVLGVEFPGHGARIAEPPPADVRELAAGPLLEAVAALADRPVAVFGHSMGALVALELCQRLARMGGPAPALFVAAGCAAPDAEHVPPEAIRMTDTEISEYMLANGGTSAAILSDPAYARVLFPLVRAELSLITRHRFGFEPQLSCPVRVYLGAQDESVPLASAQDWRKVSRGDTTFRTFPGGHFFFQGDEADTLRQLRADLDAVPGHLQRPAGV